ncbi:MAG: hypothetical protein JWN88_126 [Frankiales bacterium]|nr:hypothetical protein [Frankiales bacterium]
MGQRTGQLLGQAGHWLDEAVAALSGPADQQDVPAALAAIGDVQRALANLVRPRDGDDQPVVVRRLLLPAGPASARTARVFTREACEAWSLSGAVASAVVDLGSELVSNAERHGSGQVLLALDLHAGHVSVSVYDEGGGRPALLPYRPGVSDRGVGLQIVQHLSEEWGWTDDPPGKWVWAHVPCSAPS